MIRPSGDVRIHLYRQPVDMRKAINGLVSIVEGEMESDPFSADLYRILKFNPSLAAGGTRNPEIHIDNWVGLI